MTAGNSATRNQRPGFGRDASLAEIHERRIGPNAQPWDVAIIGGGATGISIALDAASRGLSVVLVEQADFGKGTSSRSTKLIHGGVRYLERGNITLVRDALRERTLLRKNAPHLVHDRTFLIPCRSWWQRFYFGFGMKVYDFLAAGNNFGRSRNASLASTVASIPTLQKSRIRGGVIYHDGQFDDTRLLINLAQTAHQQGACLVNYVRASGLLKDESGQITGLLAEDTESNETFELHARCVVNAGGPFCDAIRALDEPNRSRMIAPSQGVHIVLPKSFLPGDMALIVPKTSDGRVLFLIPWHDHIIVGTTDTAIDAPCLEPTPQQDEIDFLLKTTGEYLDRQPSRDDVLSVFTGIRPLVKGDKSARTASLSRDHVILVDQSGLVTITGGKWTTVRKMAEDCVDRICKSARLLAKPCTTQNLRLHGYTSEQSVAPRAYYGSDLERIAELEKAHPELVAPLDPSAVLRGSDVVWATRHEMARSVEDVLARRNRLLFLSAAVAVKIAPQVAKLMAGELGKDATWIENQIADFQQVATTYMPPNRI